MTKRGRFLPPNFNPGIAPVVTTTKNHPTQYRYGVLYKYITNYFLLQTDSQWVSQLLLLGLMTDLHYSEQQLTSTKGYATIVQVLNSRFGYSTLCLKKRTRNHVGITSSK